MVEFQVGGWHFPGTWFKWDRGGVLAIIVCPICRVPSSISPTKYLINDDGEISPQCACPTEGCLFNDNIKLIGWRK